MRFLLDEGLSPRVLDLLGAAAHDVVHAREIGLKSASDWVVLTTAVEQSRILVTLDTDFGTLMAFSSAALPSIVLFWGHVTRRPDEQVALLLANLDQVEGDLAKGAVVVIGDGPVRGRLLPIP